MRKNSIFASITFIFFVSLLGIVLTFVFFYMYDKEQSSKYDLNRYAFISKTLQYQLTYSETLEDLMKLLDDFNMKPVKEAKEALGVLNKTPVIYHHASNIGFSMLLKDNLNTYLYVDTKKYSLLLKDMSLKRYGKIVFFSIFIVIFFLILFAYFAILKRLKPLKKLKIEIDKFAHGNIDINTRMDGEDEIAVVANAFDNSVQHIKMLNNSRTLFLRNIMHELKTPITKGRIAAEMIENSKNRDRLINVFEKLENLINEFAAIERLSSGFGAKSFSSFRLVDIIDEAIDMAMINRECIELDIKKDLNVNADFKLFSIAIKNMIDNAIKYSPDKKVKVVADSDKIDFINKGEKLKKSLAYYKEPFSSDGNQKESFGLGLYIVDNILNAHGIRLKYKYKKGYNTFTFIT